MRLLPICAFLLVYTDISLCRRQFCETKPDGYYQQGVCSENFVRCQQEQMAQYVCQYEDEVFDQQKNRCIPKASAPECQMTTHPQKTKRRHKVPRVHSNEAMGDFGYGRDDTRDDNVDSENFCWRKLDGNYEVAPCIGMYIKCQNFKSHRYACRQPGFIFLGDVGDCVAQKSVPKCLSHQGSSLKQNCESSQLPEETAHQLWPCHSAFGLCNRGVFTTMSCRPGKVFDASRGKCVSPTYNSECSGLEHQSSLGQFCEMYAETKYTRNYLVPYGACADRLVDCSRFPPTVVYCKPGEIFDANHKQKCLPADQVAECSYNSQIQSPMADWSMYENADQNNLFQNWDQSHIRPIGQPYVPTDTQVPPDFLPAAPSAPAFCSTRTRGAYFQIKPGHLCPTEFRYCNGTSADNGHIFYCDEGFFVDDQFSQCRERPECKMERFEADDRSLLANQLCLNKQDGIYEMGACESDFALCTSNQGAVLHCEQGTAYSSALQICVSKSRHSQCSSEPKTDDLSLRLPENLCSSSPRPSVFGFYGCHQFFFYCSVDGRPLSQTCESEAEAFDAVYNRCIPRAMHALCPEYVPQPSMMQGFQPAVQAMDMQWFDPSNSESVADDLLQQAGLQQQCAVNGEFRPHPVTCRKFLRCDHGRYVSFNCPATTVFVPKISVCDHARNHPECV